MSDDFDLDEGHVIRSANAAVLRRGIQRILDGALNDQNEDGLAVTLGVSLRRLRRLFRLNTGITPDQLARAGRAHFARRLLDRTDLSVTDIAFASGYGSVRQFNRSVLDVFGTTPLALRARLRLRGDHDWRPAADEFVDVLAAVCGVPIPAAHNTAIRLRSFTDREREAWPWADEGGPSLLGPAKAPSDQALPH